MTGVAVRLPAVWIVPHMVISPIAKSSSPPRSVLPVDTRRVRLPPGGRERGADRMIPGAVSWSSSSHGCTLGVTGQAAQPRPGRVRVATAHIPDELPGQLPVPGSGDVIAERRERGGRSGRRWRPFVNPGLMLGAISAGGTRNAAASALT